jgi:hypothetical protein
MTEPLTQLELDQLRIYTEESLRGIVHTEIWELYMAKLIDRQLKSMPPHFYVVKTGEQKRGAN